MTLRARLALVLGILVLVPLVAAAVLVVYAVPRATNDRADSTVVSARSSVASALTNRCERTSVAARAVGRSTSAITTQAAARAAVEDGLADWAAVLSNSGRTLGSAGSLPDGVSGTTGGGCTDGVADGPALIASIDLDVAGQPEVGQARAASVVDVGYLNGAAECLGFTGDIALLRDGEVIVTTTAPEVDLSKAPNLVIQAGGEDQVSHYEGITSAIAKSRPGMPFDVVVAVPTPSSALLVQSVFLVVLVAVVVAVAIAVIVARDLTEPLEEVTHAAEAVAGGDLSRSIAVQRDDEVGRLARAFNHMTGELQDYVQALEGSRESLRANLGRLGEALSATHDLDTLLPVVLETAMSSVGRRRWPGTARRRAWRAHRAGRARHAHQGVGSS